MSQTVDLKKLKITIAGLGLMGGSMAMALKKQDIKVSAVDTSADTIKQALSSATIAEGTTDLQEGISGADLIILAMPVRKIIETIARLPEIKKNDCVLIDVGSTKTGICDSMSLLPGRFDPIGGHPMCGREKSGFGAAVSGLYEKQTFILCKTDRTKELGVNTALALIQAIGAQPAFLEAPIHDEIVSLTSHLPYLLSTSLMNLVALKASKAPTFWQISSTGLRDSVRLAGSNPQMMLQILESNHAAIVENLKEIREDLTMVIQELEKGNYHQLEERLKTAKDNHDLYLRRRWKDMGETE